jgi:Holliday junction resolvasome RuvABC endonuclease subunit
MVCRWLGLAREPDSLDESDALAVALCHALRRGSAAAAAGRACAT